MRDTSSSVVLQEALREQAQEHEKAIAVKEERLKAVTAELTATRKELERAKKNAKFDRVASEGRTKKLGILEHTVTTLRHDLQTNVERRMILKGGLLLALGIIPVGHLARAQTPRGSVPPERADRLRRFAQETIPEVGVEEVHPIDQDEQEIEEELIAVLEGDDQATVVGHVELGSLVCDSLDDALDSTELQFTIISNETVIAERTSFSDVSGSVIPDGAGRNVWTGEVVHPEPPAGSIPRTVSMTWTDPCNVESFLLKVVSYNDDGSTSIVKTVPCSAGLAEEICMVELAVVFNAEEEIGDLPTTSSGTETEFYEDADQSAKNQDVRMLTEYLFATDEEKESFHARGLRLLDGDMAVMPSGRKLQTSAQIDVLVLYTPEAYTERAISETQLETEIVAGFLTANEATSNSEIELTFNLVRVDQLPYTMVPYDSSVGSRPQLEALTFSTDVGNMRDEFQADLVLLVGYFPGTCGLGWIFNSNSVYGFSLMDSNCFDNLSHTHEMGHNLGCFHQREISSTITDYSHGFRQCGGSSPFATIMAYSNQDDCNPSPRINYFSNPDVSFAGRVTGDAANNNARTIRDNMVAVSNFRTGELSCADSGDMCSTNVDCCSGFCGSAGFCGFEACGGAGGSLETVGDSVCNAANNVPECDYDMGDCCICECTGAPCGPGDATCSSPTYDCKESPNPLDPGYYRKIGGDYCDEGQPDFGDCDPSTVTCDCTCVEGDNPCGSGNGFNCIDPDSLCCEKPPS